LIIIDNKQEVKKLAGLQVNELKNIVYLPQKENLGYAKANNLGAKYADAEWLLLLNDDVEFEVKSLKSKVKNYNLKLKIFENPIEELLEFAKKNDLDAASPILINPDGRVENYGYKVLDYGKVKLFKELTSSRVNELDGLTAACLLIKKQVYEKVGGFDESFFAYLEDVDLFLRLKKQGFRFALASDIAVFHHHRKTLAKMGYFKEKQDVINWWRLYFKHPDIIRLSPAFLMERLRNIAGLIKEIIKSSNI
jgi:GT2 family glycosyltransferase